MRVRTRVLSCSASVLAALLMSACSGPVATAPPSAEQPTALSPAPIESPAAQPFTPAPAIEALSPDAKRSRIATSFPIEVPVPAGEFVRARAQGDDAWDYTVRVQATPDELLGWFRTAYTSRQWTLVDERAHGESDGVALTFLKGNSQSQVAVGVDVDAPDTAIARVILGVGAPVLQTQ